MYTELVQQKNNHKTTTSYVKESLETRSVLSYHPIQLEPDQTDTVPRQLTSYTTVDLILKSESYTCKLAMLKLFGWYATQVTAGSIGQECAEILKREWLASSVWI